MPLSMSLFSYGIKNLVSSLGEFLRRQVSSFSWLKEKICSIIFFSIGILPIKCQYLNFERNVKPFDNGSKVLPW